MSGDIEDFLRRAAERRQARQAKKPAPPPARPRREYSDARRERAPQAPDDDDDLVVAEVVEEPLSRKLTELKRAQAAAEAMREASSEPAHVVPAPLASRPLSSRPLPSARLAPVAGAGRGGVISAAALTPDTQSSPLNDLHEALRSPHGLRNAILLSEILNRPEHRW